MDVFSWIHDSPFYELAALTALAAIVGLLGQFLRQPMIVSFIVVGLVAGPSALGIVRSHESIELLAELGIAVLLFLVGLKLDLGLIRTIGGVALATGLGQVFFTSAIGFGIGLLLGFDAVTSTYIAVALTFSSTIIIVKLLSDRREVDSLHGRIAIGFLIVQDLVVVIAMITLSAIAAGEGAEGAEGGGALATLLRVFGYGVVALAALALFIRFAADPLATRVARSPELLIVFAIAWAAILAAVGSQLGFSLEIGGLLAGVSLASTPYRDSIVARLSSVRDFLLLFFFIALGAKLDLGTLGEQIPAALVFSLFVLIGNPAIVMAIMGAMGYRRRTGFLAGLTVAQISEFSLVFIGMGLTLGHVESDALGLVTLVGLITIATSVYMITYANPLFRRLEPVLGVFERERPRREERVERLRASRGSHDVVLIGLGRYGNAIAERLRERGLRLLAVDFNPEEVRKWRRSGVDAIYGDASDHEFLAWLPLGDARWVIAALPQHDFGLTHHDPRETLIEALRERRYAGRLAVAAQRAGEADALRARGADVVLLPFHDAADRAVERLLEAEEGTEPRPPGPVGSS
jgi:Kef-type K+ transport system membrane component KefB